jgi:hypothetical protein
MLVKRFIFAMPAVSYEVVFCCFGCSCWWWWSEVEASQEHGVDLSNECKTMFKIQAELALLLPISEHAMNDVLTKCNCRFPSSEQGCLEGLSSTEWFSDSIFLRSCHSPSFQEVAGE